MIFVFETVRCKSSRWNLEILGCLSLHRNHWMPKHDHGYTHHFACCDRNLIGGGQSSPDRIKQISLWLYFNINDDIHLKSTT